MASSSKQQSTKTPGSWADDNVDISDLFDQEGIQPVPLKDIISQVETLEKKKLPDEELSDLMSGEYDRALEKTKGSKSVKSVTDEDKTPVLTKKPKFKDAEEAVDDDYEESFATQHETAELRSEMDDLVSEFKQLKSQMDLLMKERANLPALLTSMRHDLNTQLTQFSDKMYKALESHMSNPEVNAALSAVEQAREEQSDQLRTAASFLASDPKPTSPLVVKGASLSGKRKFKPIK